MTALCVAVSGVSPAYGQLGFSTVRSARVIDTQVREPLATNRIMPSATVLPVSTAVAAASADSTEVPAPASAREASEDETFTIRDFFVQGNNLFLRDRVEALLAPFTGAGRSFKDIEAARAALEKAYRDLGYPTVAVSVPEQTVEYGVITLRVYEGRLKSIDVTNAWFFSQEYIRRRLSSVRVGALLHEPTVLKELDALNANQDLKVVPVLKPTDDPERLNLELKAKDRPPIHGKVELNNRGVPTTPRLRLNAALQYTNLFDSDHGITLQTSQTPQDWGAVEVYSGNYSAPLGAPDHQLVLYGATASSRSRIGTSPLPVGGGLDIFGNSIMAGGRYFVPFAEGGAIKHRLSVGIDYKHLGQSQAMLPNGLGSLTVGNPISYTPASIGYMGVQQDVWGVTKLNVTAKGYVAGLVRQGSEEDFRGDPNDPLKKPGLRRGSSGTFLVMQGGIDRFQRLPSGFSLTVKVDGQWANEPLIPTEQYFAGGMESVRGYREFEAVGDHAAHAMIELTSALLPQLPLENIRRTIRAAVFYDVARLWVRNPLPGQTGRWNLQGAGVGLRVALSDHLRFRYDAAWALTHGPFTRAGGFYGHFSLEAMF